MTTTKLKRSARQEKTIIVREPEEFSVTDRSNNVEDPYDKVVCPYCNGYISDVDTFCIHCGKQFHEQSIYYCTRCGQDVDKAARVCPYCGVRLHR